MIAFVVQARGPELGPPDPCKMLTVSICNPSAGHREETGRYLKLTDCQRMNSSFSEELCLKEIKMEGVEE